MNRNTRTLIVLFVALSTAGLAAFGVYRAVKAMPVREVEVAHTYVVVASRAMPTGTRVTPDAVKIVPWPERAMVPGAFNKIEAVANRGIVESVQENEPITEKKLAPLAAGVGLPPTITPGMRAISVRVNDVVGVAGFVTPGTRVDVLVTLKQGNDSTTRSVVDNVQVLTAGTRYDQDKSKNGEAMPSSVVTLLLTPDDAERVVLAAAEGQIMLALRNPLDVQPTSSTGKRTANLFGEAPRPAAASTAPRVPRSKPAAAEKVPPPPDPVSPVYKVETIRAAKRSEETVR